VADVVTDTLARPTAVWLRWFVLIARLVVGGVWIGAGYTKIIDIGASVRAVRAYQLLPEAVVPVVGAALPAVEILVGVLLVVGLFVRVSSVVSALMMLAFIIGISSAWARGLRIDCGCFGSGGVLAEGEDPTYGWELARDAGLFVLAVICAWRPSGAVALDGLLRGRAIPESSEES
jgi:uncharacterized membrane protein YphA (DoxX/SURF4 family)